MPQMLTIRLDQPVASAQLVDGRTAGTGAASAKPGIDSVAGAAALPTRESESQRKAFQQASEALRSVVAKLTGFCDELFAGHKEEIARLSVEIARKILMQKVETGDYRIESIVQEALENAPNHSDVVVHLNPDDLAQCQKAQQEAAGAVFDGVKFVSDPAIGRAECLLESPKGIVKFLIDENLERISKALMKVE